MTAQVSGRSIEALVSYLERLNTGLGRWLFIGIVLSMTAGYLGEAYFLGIKPFVPFLLAIVMFAMSLSVSWGEVGVVARSPGMFLVAFAGLHVAIPFLSRLLGRLLFGLRSPLTLGLLLYGASPTAMLSIMWSFLLRANVPLAVAVVSLDSLLSPLVLPGVLRLFAGRLVSFNAMGLLGGLLRMVLLPCVLGITVHDLTPATVRRRLQAVVSPLAKLALLTVVAANTAAAKPQLVSLSQDALPLLASVVFLQVLGYLTGNILGRVSSGRRVDTQAMMYLVAMRNLSVAIVIAATYFEAVIGVPLICAMLFQQPLGALVYRLVRRHESQKKSSTGRPNQLARPTL